MRDGRRGGGGETGNDGKKEKILFMIAGKINPSLSCYSMAYLGFNGRCFQLVLKEI